MKINRRYEYAKEKLADGKVLADEAYDIAQKEAKERWSQAEHLAKDGAAYVAEHGPEKLKEMKDAATQTLLTAEEMAAQKFEEAKVMAGHAAEMAKEKIIEGEEQ